MLNLNDYDPELSTYRAMPAKYFALCIDDGKLYLYTKDTPAADLDPETGKFKRFDADINADINDIENQLVEINAKLARKQDLLIPGKNIEIIQDSEGNLVLNAIFSVEELADQLPAALKKALENQEEPSGILVDSEGNIKVSLDSEYLIIDEDGKITFADFIIQSSD